MENASKALIIAGAILLSILIITLGIGIYQMASEAMGNVGLDANEIQAYNAKFENYEGTNESGSRVRSLLDTIKQHNNSNSSDPTLQVKVYVGSQVERDKAVTPTDAQNEPATNAITAGAVTAIKNAVKSGYTYNVTMCYHEASGHVVSVIISPVKPAPAFSVKSATGDSAT